LEQLAVSVFMRDVWCLYMDAWGTKPTNDWNMRDVWCLYMDAWGTKPTNDWNTLEQLPVSVCVRDV